MAHILVADDEEKMRHLLSIILTRNGHKVEQAGDGKEALDKITSIPFDLIITDIKMPRMDGITLMKEIQRMEYSCPVIFITAFATVSSAVETMRAGAVDYITKPFEEEQILLSVERTLKISRIMNENRELRKEINKKGEEHQIVCVSEPMKKVMALANKVARTDSAVLITGESGTGKELLARFVHSLSLRNAGRFIPINCAAISPNLVESELFGYEKGAFTGADRRSQGKFEFASGGTLFLDEIGDMPLPVQAKLLRALQEKKIQRVGGHEEIDVDVRVICATNQNLEAMVEQGTFRRDLFFRINVFPINPPPLRERRADIIPLTEFFLKKMSSGLSISISDGAARMLKEYTWPGNVRELANAIERAIILSGDTGALTSETLSFLRPGTMSHQCGDEIQLPVGGILLEEVQRSLVRQALSVTANNQSAAARLLGLSRAKLRVLMKQIH